jgi:hypothetical protein
MDSGLICCFGQQSGAGGGQGDGGEGHGEGGQGGGHDVLGGTGRTHFWFGVTARKLDIVSFLLARRENFPSQALSGITC